MRWLVVCAVAWLILVELRLDHPLLAVAIVLAAAAVGSVGAPRREARLSLVGALRFAPLFLKMSLEGGWDVAKRAFRGRRAIAPGVVRYRCSFDEDDPAVPAFAVFVTLIPGTLCVGLDGTLLTLHVVDCNLPVEDDLRTVEDALARAFKAKTREEAP